MTSEPAFGASTDTPTDGPQRHFDLGTIWRVAQRRRWLILFTILGTLSVATVLTVAQQKIYGAACLLLIDVAAPKVLDGQVQEVVESGPGSFWFGREYYETQYKVIASRTVATRVVDKLHLADDSHFLGLDKIEDPVLREKKKRAIDPVAVAQSSLRVEPVRDSRLVQVRVELPDPNQAAVVANAFADEYMAETLSQKLSTTQNASEWLENQLVDLEGKLDKTTRNLYEFKKQRDIVSTSFEDKQSMVSQRLIALNDALTKTRIQKAHIQSRAEAARAWRKKPDQLTSGDAVGQLLNQQHIQQMKMRIFDLVNECSDFEARYGDKHPKLAACQERLSAARMSLQQEIDKSLAGIEVEYQETTETERKLAGLYNESKTEAFQVNQFEEEYQRLKRAMDNNQRLYDVVLKRLKDTGLSGLMRVSNVRVVDRARPVYTPVRPKVAFIFSLAILLALAMAGMLVFAAERFDSTITNQEQVEQTLGVTFLGILPRVVEAKTSGPPELIVSAHPRSVAAECCRSVRTNLLFMSPDKPLHSILITSSGPQDGKTTTAASLAITMAMGGNRVLLIDADMRRPRTHKIFKVSNEIGLSSVIVGAAKIEDAIKATEVHGLSVMVCGPVPPNPAELFHTKAFATVLRQLDEKYDLIVVDSPPVGVVSDAAIISTLVDGVLVVLKAGQTSRDQALRTVRVLKNVNARILGAVLNDLDLENRSYDYYYYGRHGNYYQPGTDEVVS